MEDQIKHQREGKWELGLWRVICGFPKIRGTFLGVPIVRILVFWGLDWGPLILGNYHMVRCHHRGPFLRHSCMNTARDM